MAHRVLGPLWFSLVVAGGKAEEEELEHSRSSSGTPKGSTQETGTVPSCTDWLPTGTHCLCFLNILVCR